MRKYWHKDNYDCFCCKKNQDFSCIHSFFYIFLNKKREDSLLSFLFFIDAVYFVFFKVCPILIFLVWR